MTRLRPLTVSLPLAMVDLCATTVAHGQAAPSSHTHAARYDIMRRVTGSIAPDPDGSGPLAFGAVRNTYSGAGLLTRVETGQLSSWQSEDVAPAQWAGFSVTSQIDTTYDPSGRKVREMATSGGVSTVTQYDYVCSAA